MKKSKERKRRQMLTKAVTALEKLRERRKDQPTAEAIPEREVLSRKKLASRLAVRYNPKTAPNSRFIDTRGVGYEIGPKGQLRRARPKIQRTARDDHQSKGKRKKENGTDGEKV